VSRLERIFALILGSLLSAQPTIIEYRVYPFAGATYPTGEGGPANQVLLQKPQGVSADRLGNVYVVDTGYHRVLRIGPDGVVHVVAGRFHAGGFTGDGGPATKAQLLQPVSAAVGPDGAVYVADQGNRRIRRVGPDGNIRTIAGTGGGGYKGDGGPAIKAEIGMPAGIAVDAAGNVFFSDRQNSVVRKITVDNQIRTVAGGGPAGTTAEAGLRTPTGIALDSAGNLYIADTANYRVRRVSPDGAIRTVAGGASSIGFGGDVGPATSAVLAAPEGVAVDRDGTLYICESGRNRVRRVTPEGVISTVVGNGTFGFSGDGGPATAAAMSDPSEVALDGLGNLLIADTGNDRIRRVSLGSNPPAIRTFAGASHAQGDDGQAVKALLYGAHGMSVDSGGNLYVADRWNNRIRKISPAGIINTVAGTDSPGYGGDGGPATKASLWAPEAVAVDAAGNIWIADTGNNRIRKVTAGGTISTVAGTGIVLTSGDGGPARDAAVAAPDYIAVDTVGNAYVATANRIRKISPAGVITTLAGTGVAGYAGDGGPATAARLNWPLGIAVDARGSVYVADQLNHCVRKVDAAGVIATFAGTCMLPGNREYLRAPAGIAFDSAGNLIVAEPLNEMVRRIAPDRSVSMIWAGQSDIGFPWGIATMGANIYVSDSVVGERIQRIWPLLPERLVVVTGDKQTGPPGAPLPAPLAVRVTGGSGIGVRAVQVNFAVTSGVASLSSPTALTDADGEAWVPVTLGALGPAEVTARVPGLQPVIFHLTGVEPAPVFPPRVTDYTVVTVAGSGDGSPATAVRLDRPYAVAVDAGGNVYITESDRSWIRKVAPDGVISTLAGAGAESGDGGPASDARLSVPVGIAADARGNIYFAELNSCRVRLITPDGVISTVAGNGICGFSGDQGPARDAQLSKPRGVALDAEGNLLIADTGNCRLRKVTTDGTIVTVAGSGDPGYAGDGGPALSARLNYPFRAAVDSGGNIFIADTSNNRIRRVDKDGIIETVAGSGKAGFKGDGGPAAVAELNDPSSVAIDPDGDLWIADTLNHCIRRVGKDGIIETVAGTGKAGFAGDGGPPVGALLSYPYDVTADAAGNVYVADGGNGIVRLISMTSRSISTVAGIPKGVWAGEGGPATQAALYRPYGICVDAARNLYISDTRAQQVRKVTPQGTITTVAGTGIFGFSGDGGPARNAQLGYPLGLAKDAAGNLYIGDSQNGRVRKVDTRGIITTVAGGGNVDRYGYDPPGTNPYYPGATVPATGAKLGWVYSIVVDGLRNVYLSDGHILKITPAGMLSAYAGHVGSSQYNPDDRKARGAGLWARQLALDKSGNLYFADVTNHRIRKISPEGFITTVAGTGNAGFSGDGGPAIEADLNAPAGVAIDAEGNLYIADGDNYRIRKVSPSGGIVTIAGNGRAGLTGDGGPATAAELNTQAMIAVDSAGNVYVADELHDRIRKLIPATPAAGR